MRHFQIENPIIRIFKIYLNWNKYKLSMLIKREWEGKQGAGLFVLASSNCHGFLHLSRTNFTKWNGLCDCGEYVSVESVCGGRLGGREKKAKLKKEGVGMRGKEKVGWAHTYPPTHTHVIHGM